MPNVSNADTWIDQELDSLKQSVESPGELASTARARHLPHRSVRGGRGAPARRFRHALHARGFDLGVGIAAVFGAIALGAVIPLLLR
jgi:hypothetical protein